MRLIPRFILWSLAAGVALAATWSALVIALFIFFERWP